MLIMGFDPGLDKSGFGVIDGSLKQPRYVASGSIINIPSSSNALHSRLAHLHEETNKLIKKYQPAKCAVEYVFSSKFNQSSLHLAMARGVILSVIGIHHLELFSYSPSAIKKLITGDGRADKSKVSLMMQRHLGMQGNFSDDASDALAASLCLFYKSSVK